MKTKSNFILSFIALLIIGNTLSLTVQAGGGCHVQNLTVINASTCNDNGTPGDPSDDYYTADVVIDYFDPPLTGSLRIFGTPLVAGQVSVPVSALSSSPFTFVDVVFKATGVIATFFGEFTDEVPACSQEANNPIVQSCSDPCAANTEAHFIAPSPPHLFLFNATPGVPVSFTVSVSDDDIGDILTLDATNIPAGATLSTPLPATGNPVSTTFDWTPGIGDVGQHFPDFSFIDLCGANDHRTYQINVADPCDVNTEAHFIAPSPPSLFLFTATPGVPMSFTVNVSDDDVGDILTLDATGIPAGATLSTPLPATGNPVSTTFNWTPGAGDVGFHYPDFSFIDLCGAQDHRTYQINVTGSCVGNITPAFIAQSPACGTLINATEGVPVSFTVTASDADAGDIVTLTSTVPQAAATVTPSLPTSGNPVSATFNWTPTLANVGPIYSIIFTATDNCGDFVTCYYTIVVAADPCAGNTAPDFIAPTPACPSTIPATVGVPLSFTVSGSDADVGDIVGLFGIIPAGATMSPPLITTGNPVSSTFDWTPAIGDVGLHVVQFQVRDICSAGHNCFITIDVADPCETNTTPAFIAPSPACGAVIPFPVGLLNSFTVNASDAEAADIVTLDIAGVLPAGSTIAQILPAAGNPVSSTFSWTPAAGDVGLHVVTFTATDDCGHQALCSYTLNVYDCSTFTVNAGADAQSFYGYPPQQTVTHTAVPSGGTPPYTYAWSMSRDLICNSVNTAGDESFSGGTCSNVTCPGTGTPASSPPYPSCTGNATINASLLANAVVCVTVTDAGGCTATDCFTINAEDVRCFAGNSGPKKVKVCHHTGSATNPWVQICVYKNAVHAHLVANPGDYLGICAPKLDNAAYSDEMEMFVYPNPAQNQVTVEFDSPTDATYLLSVFDITGRVVLSNTGSASEGGNKVVMPINDLARGLYNIRLTVGDESSSVRLIVTE
ncbi:MAG TPA: T9SS type A sorting domain-containing protein [Bacteroidia bacterium]|nr:T9SS type A sorting domain-containing protein [Bacteroidia bacterium]